MISPYGFVQEPYKDDVWKVLICCMMLNQTSHIQVRAVLKNGFFEKYPDHMTMAKADPIELAHDIKSLGFYNRRAKAMIRMSQEFNTKDVQDLHGIGKYAHDAYLLFCLGIFRIVEPKDKELIKYKAWLETL